MFGSENHPEKRKVSISLFCFFSLGNFCQKPMQARRGNSWLWRKGDSDSGISSSEGSGSILRRGVERTKFWEESVLRGRRDEDEEQLLRERTTNSLHRRAEGIQDRGRGFHGSLLRREKEKNETDWNWTGSRWDGRRARSQSDARTTRRQVQNHGEHTSGVSRQLWRRRSGSRGEQEVRSQSQPRPDYFYKKQIERVHNEDMDNWVCREEKNLRGSRRCEEAWEIVETGHRDEEVEDARRVSRTSIIHRTLNRSKTGERQDERTVKEGIKQKKQLDHTLSDKWTEEADIHYSARDICGSLLRGDRSLLLSNKSVERRPAEGHKAIWEDEPNIKLVRVTMDVKPRVSLRRLSKMSSHHHLPRLPTRPLTGSLRSSSCSSLSQASSASRPMPFLLTSSSTSSLSDREEAISLAHIDQNMIVHSYVASRGQREKEVEIYEHLPACRLIKPRNNMRLGSVSVC